MTVIGSGIDYQRLGEEILTDLFRSDWIFIITIIPVLLFLIAASVERKSITSKYIILFNLRYANTEFRNAGSGRQLGSFLTGTLTLFSFANILLFAQIEFAFYPWGLEGLSLWFFNIAALMGALILRYIASGITGEISGNRELFREYMFNIISFYKLLGVILIIINFSIPYLTIAPNRFLIILAIILFLGSWVMRILRLILLFIKGNFSLFYLILYLCALEFAPVLIFSKYISGTL